MLAAQAADQPRRQSMYATPAPAAVEPTPSPNAVVPAEAPNTVKPGAATPPVPMMSAAPPRPIAVYVSASLGCSTTQSTPSSAQA